MRKNNHTSILLLGGGGLVGSEIISLLATSRYSNISVVAIGSKSDRDRLNNLENKFQLNIKKYWANIYVPPEFSSLDFKDIVSDKKKLRSLEKYALGFPNDNSIINTSLFNVINKVKPNIIVDCINSASVFSLYKSLNGKKEEKEELYLVGLGEQLLIRNTLELHIIFRRIKKNQQCKEFCIKKYIKIGTTGSGGMSLDIPFTHGDNKPSAKLLRKISFAGSQTQLLYSLNKAGEYPEVIEIKPAASLFSDKVVELDNRKKNLKCYEIKSENSKENLKRKPKSISGPDKMFFVDGGESGYYEVEEFRLLASPDQMGYIHPKSIAKEILKQIGNRKDDKNVLSGIRNTVILPTDDDYVILKNIILNLEKRLKKKEDFLSIASGNLGPPSIQQKLIECYIINKFLNKTKDNDNKDRNYSDLINHAVEKDENLIGYVLSKGMIIRFDDGRCLTSLNANDDTLLRDLLKKKQFIDLSKDNIDFLVRKAHEYKRKYKKFPSAGRIVSHLINSGEINV